MRHKVQSFVERNTQISDIFHLFGASAIKMVVGIKKLSLPWKTYHNLAVFNLVITQYNRHGEIILMQIKFS